MRLPENRGQRLGWAARAGVAASAVAIAGMSYPIGASAAAKPNRFAQTNLIANKARYHAALVDPNLTNAWGLAAGPNSPIWVSDNNSGDAGVYTGGVNGSPVTLDLTVPVPGGNPTGQVFNSDTTAFPVGGPTGSPALFIVDTDSIGATQSPGQIEAWNGGSSFVVEDSPTGGAAGTTPPAAVFKGLAIATGTGGKPELLAADVANGRIDVFDQHFKPLTVAGAFSDPAIPARFVPFNVETLGAAGDVFVTYAKQNASHTDVVPGSGYLDVYSPDGALLHHLAGGHGSPLDEPWGLTIAPAGFGPFAGRVLVGNLGNGWINAFDQTTGKYLGALDTTAGSPIAIHGLWGLAPGNTNFGGTKAVIFSAGPRGYNDGLVGILTPGPAAAHLLAPSNSPMVESVQDRP